MSTNMYTIMIHYSTGDSFGSSDTTDELPVLWENLDKAKEALRVIKKHKEACDEIRASRYRSHEKEILKKYEAEYWFCTGKNFEDSHDYNFYVLDDNDDKVRVYAFWMGYFENIQFAEIIIVPDKENDMKIIF